MKNGDGRRILLVEDDDELRDLIEHTLTADGFRVMSCVDAETALERAHGSDFGLVITDINLGVTSGLELITRLQRELPRPAPPIIACSAMDEYEGEAIRLGAVAFLRKPFHRDSLREAIAAAEHREPLPETAREDASRKSHVLRLEALELADEALTRLAPQREELHRRVLWSARWLPRYLGIGAAVVGLVRDRRLRIVASSDAARFPTDAVLDEHLPLATAVVEAASTIVIPDLVQLGLVSHGCRMFAGVPFRADDKAVGAVCLVHDHPGPLVDEDLALLQAVGRRASSVLSRDGGESGTHPFWSDSGWLTRPSMELLVSLELRRAARTDASIAVFVFEATNSDGRAPLEEIVRPTRSAMGSIGPERYLVLLGRERSDADVEQEITDMARALLAREDVRGMGLVTFEGVAVGLSAETLLMAAESACSRSVQGRTRKIERLRIRHDAPSDASAAGSLA